VRIAGLTGGDAAAGGRGGDVIGVASGGPTAITDTVISGLRGGAGGPGADAATATPGGTGGLAVSVVASLPPGADLTVDRSQFTDNTGGRGGAGGAWSAGDHHGVPGGDGGSAVGVQANGDAVTINAVTVASMRGGWGGTGGPGHAAQGAAKAGTDGGVGSGGEADGLLLTGVGSAAPAALSVTNSTISDNTGGAGGTGGSGAGISLGLASGGTGRATLVHNTVVNNAGAATMPPEGSVAPAAPALFTTVLCTSVARPVPPEARPRLMPAPDPPVPLAPPVLSLIVLLVTDSAAGAALPTPVSSRPSASQPEPTPPSVPAFATPCAACPDRKSVV